MTTTQETSGAQCAQCERYRRRWLRLVWAVTVAAVLLPLVGMWAFVVIHSRDEDVPVVRNEVVQDALGVRVWRGAILAGAEYRHVAITIHFLDKDNRTVGETTARADVLRAGQMLPLEAPLPASAVRMQMYWLQWRNEDNVNGLFGPYKPWEFGYLQRDPNR